MPTWFETFDADTALSMFAYAWLGGLMLAVSVMLMRAARH